jgi:hypothetical protein
MRGAASLPPNLKLLAAKACFEKGHPFGKANIYRIVSGVRREEGKNSARER